MPTLSSSVLTITGLAISLLFSGCTLKSTLQQTTDTTSNMSGTTSSAHSWVAEDGLLKPEHKAIAFVTLNQTNIQQDLATGHGEYLTALSTLLGVPVPQQLAYGAAVQSRYTRDLDGIGQSPAIWLSLLRDTAQPFRSSTADHHQDR